MHEIHTTRAVLRPVAPDDLDALHALFVDPEVRRFLWDDEVVARAVTEDVIARSQSQFRDQGHGLWLARLAQTSDPAGFAGFWYFHEPPQLELLYGLAPTQWGRGLATEIAAALLRHGFGKLGFARIVGSTDAPNTASCRVMERLGMRFLKREIGAGRHTVYYAVDRPAGP